MKIGLSLDALNQSEAGVEGIGYPLGALRGVVQGLPCKIFFIFASSSQREFEAKVLEKKLVVDFQAANNGLEVAVEAVDQVLFGGTTRADTDYTENAVSTAVTEQYEAA